MNKMSLYKLKPYILKSTISNLLISVITALAILPFFTASASGILSKIISGNEALGIFYYPRIFSINEAWFKIGNFFIEPIDSTRTPAEFGMLGDLIQRIIFKIFSENIVLTYKIISFIYLSIWLYFLTKIILPEDNSSFLKAIVLVCISLVIFFGNRSLINSNYGFSRLISPQVSVLIWILTIYCIYEFFRHYWLGIGYYKYLFLFSILILISSFTYLFTFLVLLSVAIIFLLNLLYSRQIKKIIIFLPMLFISCVPFGFNAYKNQSNLVFSQVLERMGLFESRLPGSIKTIWLCLLLFLLIFIYYRLTPDRLSENPFVLSMLICNTGTLVASQSNVISNKSIQFYHFEVYAYILLLLIISKILLVTLLKSIILTKIDYYTEKTPILVLIVLILLQITFTNIKLDGSNEYKQFFSNNFSQSSNLAVDINSLNYTIPIYTKSKVLYQGDIIAYNFSNAEIMQRYFVNSGCPKQISFETVPGLFDYRIQPTLQKGNQVFRYLRIIHQEQRFDKLYLPYYKRAMEIESIIGSEIQEFFKRNNTKDCLQLARQFGIDYIVFDRESNWINFFKLQNLSVYEVNKMKIFAVKISAR